MRLPHIAIILATAAALAAPAPCAAQEPVTSFDQLNTRLKPGDTVWVTDGQGREVKGKIHGARARGRHAEGATARTFAAGDVRLISARRDDRSANGALIGLAVGRRWCRHRVPGDCEDDRSEQGWCLAGAAPVYGGIGAGIGVGIDALIPGKKLVGLSRARLGRRIRRPASRSRPSSRRARRASAVSFAF